MIKGYYFITDSTLSRLGIEADVKSAVAAGVEVIQYRNKCAPTRLMCEEASRLKRLSAASLFLVNDRVDVALAVEADGVHLGQNDMPLEKARAILGKKKIIGITVTTIRQAFLAAKARADYLAVAPIFTTHTKEDAGTPVGLETLRKIKKHFPRLPLVAIGGITVKNVAEVVAAGADSVCAISAVVSKRDVKAKIIQFQRYFPTKEINRG